MAEEDRSDGELPAFKLLLTCPGGFSPSQVNVEFAEAYDRIPHPDVNLESSVSEIWNKKVQSNSSLFNGKKFRFGGFSLSYDNHPSKQASHVVLKLGLTDYRTFTGTNLSPLWEKFLTPSEDDILRCQHTSSPLGNGAVVETADKKILLLKRSHNVGEFPGHFVFPGGHPEPQDAGVFSHEKDFTDSDVLNKKVAQEMFDSIIREVVEEIGVPANSLHLPDLLGVWVMGVYVSTFQTLLSEGDPIFIGITRRELNVRPAAFFFIRCALESQEIQKFYASAQDGFESTQLHAVSGEDLKSMVSEMPGCHQGGFALYRLMVETMSGSR